MPEKPKLTPGKKAPKFKLPDQAGELISLDNYSGKWLILYFYPKDNTSGCTAEAVDFTSKLPELRGFNADVLGISPDSCSSHQKFIQKYSLTVTLLSDTEKTTLEKYGVWTLKSMYGREYYGVERTTFLIAPDGTIKHIWNKVKVNGHTDQVITKLRELQAEAK